MTQHSEHRIGSHSPFGTTPVPATEALLSPESVAAFLSIPVKTLYQWRYKGVGPRGLRIGRHLRYLPADVEAWLKEVQERGHRGEVA
jgi:predicted DNA-binding transcriptional regulator AlpA